MAIRAFPIDQTGSASCRMTKGSLCVFSEATKRPKPQTAKTNKHSSNKRKQIRVIHPLRVICVPVFSVFLYSTHRKSMAIHAFPIDQTGSASCRMTKGSLCVFSEATKRPKPQTAKTNKHSSNKRKQIRVIHPLRVICVPVFSVFLYSTHRKSMAIRAFPIDQTGSASCRMTKGSLCVFSEATKRPKPQTAKTNKHSSNKRKQIRVIHPLRVICVPVFNPRHPIYPRNLRSAFHLFPRSFVDTLFLPLFPHRRFEPAIKKITYTYLNH